MCAFAAQSRAAAILYTFAGTGSGDVNGTAFTNSAFTIRVFADTDDVATVIEPGFVIYAVEDTSSHIAIAGFNDATFATDKRVFVNQTNAALGFALGAGGDDLLDLQHSSFANYGLKTEFAPLFRPIANNAGFSEPTNLGTIRLVQIKDVTFSAVVPEPSSICFIGACTLSLLCQKSRVRVCELSQPDKGSGR